MIKRKNTLAILFFMAFMAAAMLSGTAAVNAETSEEMPVEKAAQFMLWLYEKADHDGGYNKVVGYDVGVEGWDRATEGDKEALTDVLKVTDTDEYLIPVTYFEETYSGKYEFDETEACPFLYAPNSISSEADLTSASYVQVDNKWYVKIKDAGSYAEPNIPRSNIYYDSYIGIVTDAVNHPSSVINLFDYWLTDQDAADNVVANINKDPDSYKKGINKDHALKFTKNPGSHKIGNWNKWTKSTNVYQGIVANKLMGNYPALSENKDVFTGETSDIEKDLSLNESLDYLFSPLAENQYKESHRNVKGLLQLDKDGYYYYDSSQNFAEYNEDSNSFTLYDTWGIKTGGSSPNGQFFPYNSMRESVNTVSTDASINHYFGMTLTTRFIQRYGGHVSSDRKSKETVFNFAGDDDVWIFIDDVLVADLGGIHDKASVSINFATGDVTINKERETGAASSQSTTLRDAFEAAGALDTAVWAEDGNTFADSTSHVLKFFYMERGNTDSNLSLQYNLNEIPKTAINKVDQYGTSIKGASFAVYAADKDSDGKYQYLDGDGKAVVLPEDYDYDNSGNLTDARGAVLVKALYTGTTNDKGEMVFVDDDGLAYSLRELQSMFGTHFILRETKAPEGYRLVSDEIYLRISDGVLLCDNTYESGVWSSPVLQVTAPNTLTLASGTTYENKGDVEFYVPDTESVKPKGTLFAVVLKYKGSDKAGLTDETNWAPVCGNSKDGYTVADVSEYDCFAEAAIEAAKKDKGKNVFRLSESSATMQLEMADLPGDIQSYYHLLDRYGGNLDNTEYTVGYYWTSAENLEGANRANTYRVDAEDKNNIFDRVFGATIEVPNLINRLFAQKLDEKGNLVNDALFALYKTEEEDGNIYYLANDEAGTPIRLGADNDADNEGTAYLKEDDKDYTYKVDAKTGDIAIRDGADTVYTIKAYQTAKTLAKDNNKNTSGESGTASFTNMSNGTYYMREVKAPAGYLLNTKEVMVLVVDDAVYANAGTADDDVTVARGPGYVVSTLSKFASEGDIDNTLTWVYERMRVSGISTSYSDFDKYTEWKYLKENNSAELASDPKDALTTYLVHDPDGGNALFNYTINGKRYDEDSFSKASRRLYTSVGWSYYEIYQDYEYGSKNCGVANYQNLKDYGDIANLFSRSIYIQMTDKKAAGTLEISKTVKNTRTDQNFDFTVGLYQDNEKRQPLNGRYSYTVYEAGANGERSPVKDSSGNTLSGTIKSGDKLSLQDGQIAVIEELPSGTVYSVTEEAADSFAVTSSGEEGTITAQDTKTAAFINTYEPMPVSSRLKLSKILNGRDMVDGQFEFVIEAKDESSAEKAGIARDTEGNWVKTVKSGAASDGEASEQAIFGKNMEFGAEDVGKVYQYKISEKDERAPGYTYDRTVYQVTIQTTDKNGMLEVTTAVSDGTETKEYTATAKKPAAAAVEFVNSYKAEGALGDGSVSIKASKTLTNLALKKDQFEFVVKDKKDNIVAKGTNDASGKVAFSNIEYTTDSLKKAVASGIASRTGDGTYELQYDVSEATEGLSDKGITANASSFSITVTVTDNGDGTLTPAVAYPADSGDGLSFENTYNAKPALLGINGQKQLAKSNASLTLALADIAGKYNFTITGKDENGKDAPLPEKTTASNDAAGNISFGNIRYELSDLDGVQEQNGLREKVYTYTVSETGSAAGVVNDNEKEKTFEVKATYDSDSGILTAALVQEEDPAFTFVNTYGTEPNSSSVTGSFDITKTLEGRDLAAGEFTFQLKDEDGTVVSSGTNDKDGKVKMSAVEFKTPGTYTYTLAEKNGGRKADGVIYDSSVYDVTAEVTDQKDGTLSVKWKLGQSDKVTFSNSYEAEKASVSLAAVKRLKGRDLKDGEFSFVLKDSDGNRLQTAANSADGSVLFKAISYEKAGVYEYTISEVKGNAEHVSYDETVYQVTVTVEDDLKGKLTASVDYNGKDLIFTNVWDNPEPGNNPSDHPNDSDNPGTGQTRTGDDTPIFLLVAVMLTALAVMAVAVGIRKKRRT